LNNFQIEINQTKPKPCFLKIFFSWFQKSGWLPRDLLLALSI